MTVLHVRTIPGQIPPDFDEYIEGHKESAVGTGDQHFAITLSKGSDWAIREVFIYLPGAVAGAEFDVARGTTGTHVDIAKNVKYDTATFITFDETIASSLGLVIRVNHGSASAQDVYVTVKYYYK